MKPYVLDSSAVLAIAFDEQGGRDLARILPLGAISAVNATEVVSRLIDRGEEAEGAREVFSAFGLEVVAFDSEQAHAAAALRKATRQAGLSLGDRACLALADARSARVITADRAWADLNVGVEIEVIR